MKICTVCFESKDESQYSFKNKEKGKLREKCKKCVAEYSKLHYQKNKKDYRARNKLHTQRVKDYVREYKSNNPCMDCGIKYPHYVMDFDHREGVDKFDNIARLTNSCSWKQLHEEIAKCDLVCANCHRYRTHKRKQKQ